jgi:acetyl-CoA carboxylase carboxyl transferase subunit beta
MSWLTDCVRPKIKSLVKPNDIPDNFWTKCQGCGEMIFHKELEQNFYVCPKCDYHLKIDTDTRLKLLFGEEDYFIVDLPNVQEDPLNFSDSQKYKDRLKANRKKTNQKEALTVAYGKIGEVQTVVGVLDFAFMGGSMGVVVGEAIVAAVQMAVTQKAPLVLVTASGGARMQEGMMSLMQMVRTIAAVKKLKESEVPFIVIMTNPTTGGVTASFATQGDVIIAESGATIGFAGARVIEQTIHQKLPEGFQTAEYLLNHGMVDIVCHRRDLRETLLKLIKLLYKQKQDINDYMAEKFGFE